MTTRLKAGISKRKAFLASPISTPRTVPQALKHEQWRTDMETEYHALLTNNTWTLVPSPPNTNLIGCKWLFKLKYKPDGSIDRYKARLVAQGFTQTHGVDYFDTFSPVVKPCTIRIVLTLALSSNWIIWQLDIQNAFLNGDLQECVYMHQPPGFISTEHPSYVCRLNKALYGLKQAPRAWFHKLSTALLAWGFQASRADSSLFYYITATDIVILLIYVDDILVTGSSPDKVSSFIQYLHTTFALRDLGDLSYFLGLEVTRDSNFMHLRQHKYIQDLLLKTDMLDAKPAATPGSTGKQLSLSDGEPLPDPTLYRSTVGALQYVTLTRPELAFAVNKACQFMANPTSAHWSVVKRILRYLKGTPTHGLMLHGASNLPLEGYSDADWASCPDDRRSTSGYCLFLGPNLISWSSSKQKMVSRSSAESEYRSLASLTAEITWVQAILRELCVSQSSPPTIWCDNKSAAALAANPVFHARSKHIELDLHFIRDKVLQHNLVIQYIPSEEQPADILTKHLASAPFSLLRTKLSIVPHLLRFRGDESHNKHQETAVHNYATSQ